MTWWPFVVVALAAYRTFRLLAEDAILDGPRCWVLRLPRTWKAGEPIPKKYREKWADFLTCPWCLGFWIVLCWWGAWELWPHATMLAALPFALSAVVGAVAHALTDG